MSFIFAPLSLPLLWILYKFPLFESVFCCHLSVIVGMYKTKCAVFLHRWQPSSLTRTDHTIIFTQHFSWEDKNLISCTDHHNHNTCRHYSPWQANDLFVFLCYNMQYGCCFCCFIGWDDSYYSSPSKTGTKCRMQFNSILWNAFYDLVTIKHVLLVLHKIKMFKRFAALEMILFFSSHSYLFIFNRVWSWIWKLSKSLTNL